MLKTWSAFPHLVGQPCLGFICVAAAGHTTAGADSAFPVVALWYQAVLVWVGRAFLVCLQLWCFVILHVALRACPCPLLAILLAYPSVPVYVIPFVGSGFRGP